MQEWISEWMKLKTRGEIKRVAKEIEQSSKRKKVLLEALQKNGVEVLPTWSSKKLLRLLLNRSEKSQIRTNPIHRNETFVCVHCSKEVPFFASKIRDHCPFCLRSLHVDITPGDRASDCGALLEPIAFFLEGGTVYIEYECSACQYQHRVRAHPTDNIPSSLSVEDISWVQ